MALRQVVVTIWTRNGAGMAFRGIRACTARTLLHFNAAWQPECRRYLFAGKRVSFQAEQGLFPGVQSRSLASSAQTSDDHVPQSKPRAPPTSQVTWPGSDHLHHNFDPIFLRDCCSCELCVDPSTTQKTFETANIPPNIRAKRVDVQYDGRVHISWEPDLPGFENHVSIYDALFGFRNRDLKSRLEATYDRSGPRIPWDRRLVAKNILSVRYQDLLNPKANLSLASLQHLHRYGLLFIHSVPASCKSVAFIANGIGPVRRTLYGSTWDVKSVASAKNVAYTSSHLGFHMDLLYVDNPPGLQILHCLKASTEGGESLFSDALRAVQKIEQTRPDHYATLRTFPVTYKYHNNNEWYQQTRPHIETVSSPHGASDYAIDTDSKTLEPKPSIKAINWSPPFQGPFLADIGNTAPPPPAADDNKTPSSEELWGTQSPDSDLRKYLDAIKHMKQELEADEAVYETKLEPGTAVIFDNRRIVHARKAFENTEGERWLRGAYVDGDVFESRLRVLTEEAAKSPMQCEGR